MLKNLWYFLVYRFSFPECTASYTDEATRRLTMRIKERFETVPKSTVLKHVKIIKLCKTELSCMLWIFFFFNCYLAVPRPTLGHSQGDSLTNSMLITAFCTYSTQRSLGASQWGWVPKPGWAPSRFWIGNLLILIAVP